MSAQLEPATSVRQIIREHLALSDKADPHTIAGEIAADLPEDSLREIAREGLVSLIRFEIRQERRSSLPANHSAKWANASAVVQARPEIFRRRYSTPYSPDGWKFLGDFTREDAEWNRDQHRTLAAQCEQRAHSFEVLAKRLRERGVVRDQLKPGDVEEIFNA